MTDAVDIQYQSKDTKSYPIQITDKALERLKNIRAEQNLPEEYALRIAVKGGGCSGFTYQIGLTHDRTEGDAVLEYNELNVYVDPKSLSYLEGTTLDFQDDLNGKGFVFNNPKAVKTCGCGSSFGV